MATITKTIGAAGDYTTPALAASAFVAGTVSGASAADDIVFNIIDNAAFNSTFLITANPGGYASYRLTSDASVRHDGTYGSGARIVISTGVENACSDTVSALTGTIEWIEITTTGAGKISTAVSLSATFNASHTKTVRNCLIHDNGNADNVTIATRTVAIGVRSQTNGVMVCNINIYDNLISNWTSGRTTQAIGIAATSTTATANILNNTVDGIDVLGGTSGTVHGIRCQNDADHKVSNNVVTKIGTNTTTGTKACFQGNGGSTVGTNNASDDSSAFGSGALTSIVRVNNFNDPDNGDYRPLNNSVPIYAAGIDLVTTPSGVQFDLKGRDRDTSGDTWSIGGYQLSAGSVVVNSVTIVAPTAHTIKQRSSGTATYTVSGTYGGTPTNIEVQQDGGAWSTLQAGPTAGVFSGTISVATGVHTIAVRFSNDTGTTDSVSNVKVGDVFLCAGQSNMDGRLTNDQTYSGTANYASVYDADDTAWRELIDPCSRTGDGTFLPLLATEIVTAQNVPVGFICTADGGTPMLQWFTTTEQSKWTAAKARFSTSGVNAIAAVLWDLGETDMADATPEATFNTYLDNLTADIVSTYGCPLISTQTGTRDDGSPAADIDAIRIAQTTAWTDNVNVKPGPVGYDRLGLHWESDAEGSTLGRRWWYAVQQVLYSGTSARGPRFSSITVNDDRDEITVVSDITLYATDTAYGAGAWSVKLDGVAETISSVARSGATGILITLAAPAAVGTLTVSFASGDTGANLTNPRRQLTAPSTTTVFLPMEPFYDEEATSGTPVDPNTGDISGIRVMQSTGLKKDIVTDAPTAGKVLTATGDPTTGATWEDSVATPLTVYAAGTAYQLTATPAALDFGTTDPTLTLTSPGTYLLFARVNLLYNAATFAAVRDVALKLRRTNNTAADVTNSAIALKTEIITALTYSMPGGFLPPVVYTTANSNDAIALFGSVSVVPTAGSLDCTEASIVAVKLHS